MEKGIYEGAEQFFKNAFEISGTPFEKVDNKFFLGRIYLYFNRTEEARAAFEYVIENGGKLASAASARQLINQVI